MAHGLPVDNHSDRRAIRRNREGVLSQSPAEIEVRAGRSRSTLTRRVNGTEWLSGMRVVDTDRLGAQIERHAGFVMRYRVQLVSTISETWGSTIIRQAGGQQHVAPTRTIAERKVGISRGHIRTRTLDQSSV